MIRAKLILIALSIFTTATMSGQKTLKNIDVLLSSNTVEVDAAAEVELTLTITNYSSKNQKFCKYHTPFEGFSNEFLEVFNADGEEIEYLGVMKKRSKPAKDDYIYLCKGDSKTVSFKISDYYDVSKKSTYKITFKGNEYINGLPDSNTLTVKVGK